MVAGGSRGGKTFYGGVCMVEMSGESFTFKLGTEILSTSHRGKVVTFRIMPDPAGHRLDLECEGFYWRINREDEAESYYTRHEAEDTAQRLRSEMGPKACHPEIWVCPICDAIRIAESIESDTRMPSTEPIRDAWPPEIRHRPASQLPVAQLLQLIRAKP